MDLLTMQKIKESILATMDANEKAKQTRYKINRNIPTTEEEQRLYLESGNTHIKLVDLHRS